MLTFDGILRSDDDVELVVKIPFTSQVVIKSINIVGGDGSTAPTKVKLYSNVEHVDFSILEDREAT